MPAALLDTLKRAEDCGKKKKYGRISVAIDRKIFTERLLPPLQSGDEDEGLMTLTWWGPKGLAASPCSDTNPTCMSLHENALNPFRKFKSHQDQSALLRCHVRVIYHSLLNIRNTSATLEAAPAYV